MTTQKTKVIAITNVVAWGAFWVFGALAITTPVDQWALMVTDALLAAMGGALGLWCFLYLSRRVRPEKQPA